MSSNPRDFAARVLSVVRRIPSGRVATYGDVAALAGRPKAARAVGNVMRSCARPDVPCHRVVAAGGFLGGYGGSPAIKRYLLAAEGVIVHGSRIRNLAAHRVSRPPRAGMAGGASWAGKAGRTGEDR
jgi:methylated-DNA-[protein]-cysteine S-methyltransferase